MKKLVITALFALAALAQTNVIVAEGPPTQSVFGYSGTLLTYVCESPSVLTAGQRFTTFVAISGVSKAAAAAVVTSTAHGFPISGRPKVTISGATGTGWTAINAEWTATIIDANTFSIPIDSSGFGTLAGTVVFRTSAPRLAVAEWRVQKLVYDGSSLLIWKGWLNGLNTFNSKCSEGTSTSVQQQ